MSWDELLDRLEAEAEALEAFATRPGDPAAELDPDDVIVLEAPGPLPGHLASRAAAVQAALDAAAASLAAARDRVAIDLVTVGQTDHEPRAARYIDTNA